MATISTAPVNETTVPSKPLNAEPGSTASVAMHEAPMRETVRMGRAATRGDGVNWITNLHGPLPRRCHSRALLLLLEEPGRLRRFCTFSPSTSASAWPIIACSPTAATRPQVGRVLCQHVRDASPLRADPSSGSPLTASIIRTPTTKATPTLRTTVLVGPRRLDPLRRALHSETALLGRYAPDLTKIASTSGSANTTGFRSSRRRSSSSHSALPSHLQATLS